jgi:NADH dehydrogenase
VPTPEEANLAPESAYGRSKLAAERLALDAAQAGLRMSIIRPTVIYGPRDRHFTPLALRLARLPLLPLIDGGERLLDLVYVQDVADQMVRMLSTPQANGRIFNCGSGRPTSIRALVDAYRALTGRGPRLLNISLKQATRTAWLSRRFAKWIMPGVEGTLTPAGLDLMARDNLLDMQRTADELGFQPRFRLEDGLRLVLEAENASQ